MDARANMCRRALAAVAAVLALAACSSSSPVARSTTSSSTRAATGVKPAATTYGQDAALLASRVPGCADVAAQDIGGGGETGMVAKAGCTLLGHQVVIYTWKDAASQDGAVEIVASSMKHYAKGTGWIQTLGDDAQPDAQAAVAGAVAKALGGTAS